MSGRFVLGNFLRETPMRTTDESSILLLMSLGGRFLGDFQVTCFRPPPFPSPVAPTFCWGSLGNVIYDLIAGERAAGRPLVIN